MSDEQHIHIGDPPMSHEEALDEIERLRGELFTCKADKCEALNRIEELESGVKRLGNSNYELCEKLTEAMKKIEELEYQLTDLEGPEQ